MIRKNKNVHWLITYAVEVRPGQGYQCMCVCVGGIKNSVLGIFLNHSPSYLFETGSLSETGAYAVRLKRRLLAEEPPFQKKMCLLFDTVLKTNTNKVWSFFLCKKLFVRNKEYSKLWITVQFKKKMGPFWSPPAPR